MANFNVSQSEPTKTNEGANDTPQGDLSGGLMCFSPVFIERPELEMGNKSK